MAVFRVERNKGYTVMSNHHLRNKELTLKAKGLLSQMLSLPEDWDYTLAGLAFINRESIDAIRTAIWELEREGYIRRSQNRNDNGKMADMIYTIYEQPVLENPISDKPVLENPTSENPISGNPTSENPMQSNKDISKTDLPKEEKRNTDISNTDSLPFPSLSPFPCESDEAAGANGSASVAGERKRRETAEVYRAYEQVIKENIEYDLLREHNPHDCDCLDEIVDIILETVCTSRKRLRIAGDDFPAEMVKSKFLKLNSEHIEFVMGCMQENTTKIRNIRQYLKASLFNAPSSIRNYYTALVSHDMASPDWNKTK